MIQKRITGVYLYNRKLLNNKEEETTDMHNNMDESQKYYTKQKKPDKVCVYISCMCVYIYIKL